MTNGLTELFTPVVESEGAELVEVEYKKEGQAWVIRVFVDKEGGIQLEDCERISRSLSALLDVEDPITRNYSLEVSSPGLGRPLKKISDYQRFTDKLVKVRLFSPLDGRKTLVGRLKKATDQTIEIRTDSENIEIPFTEIAKARLEPELFPVKSRTPSS